MTQSVPTGDGTTSPSVHTVPTRTRSGVPNIAKQLQASAEFIIEGILGQVLIAFGGVSIFGIHPFAALSILGKSIVDNANAAYAQSLTAQTTATAANTKSDNIIDALTSFVTGGSTTGNDPLSMLLGFLGQAEKLPANLLALLTAHKATTASLQAQTNAALTGGFVHDFAKGVTGWTTLTPTALVKSILGPFVQPSTVTVAYRASGLAVDAYGVHMDVNPTMQGLCWVGICPTTAGANWAGLMMYRGFDGDALWLVTGASPTLWAVQKSVAYTGDNRLSGVTALSLETDGVSAFSVLCNGDPVPELNWTDSGGIVTHGASNRGVILGANGFDRNENGFRGPAPMKVASYVA